MTQPKDTQHYHDKITIQYNGLDIRTIDVVLESANNNLPITMNTIELINRAEEHNCNFVSVSRDECGDIVISYIKKSDRYEYLIYEAVINSIIIKSINISYQPVEIVKHRSKT